MAVVRSLVAGLGLIMLGAGAASAQPFVERPDAWVGEDGRILHDGAAQPANRGVHPATRADWIGECNRRLIAANRDADSGIGFDSACRIWLRYYEDTGVAARGYDFAYAIPVRVATETRITTVVAEQPCDCAPPPRRPVMRRATRVRDKRVRM